MPKRTVIVVSACVLLASAMIAVVACDKSGGGKNEPASSSASATSTAPMPLASAPAVDTAVSSAAVSVVAPPPSPPSSAATASGHVAPKASASAAASASASAKGVTARVPGKNFVLDVTSTGCRVDAQCAMTIRLQTSGDYHVNKEYPYKFNATPGPAVQFLGTGDANTFSRAAGDFREEGEKTATMTVRFKPKAAGQAKVSGTYKMSVCSADNCQIEQTPVELSVPVM